MFCFSCQRADPGDSAISTVFDSPLSDGGSRDHRAPGGSCDAANCVEYESVDFGKVWGVVLRPSLAAGAPGGTPTSDQTVDGAMICTRSMLWLDHLYSDD